MHSRRKATQMANTPRRRCFIIGTIGSAGSPERIRSDWVKHSIIKPTLEKEPFNYVVERADDVADPGLITDQIIVAVEEADLVVADLTGFNPNVLYELGIRHTAEKAVIHMIEEGTALPFDLKDYRSVFYKLTAFTDHQLARDALEKQALAVEREGHEISNPVTRARGNRKLRVSADSKDKVLADAVARLERLEVGMAAMSKPPSALGRLIVGSGSDLLRTGA